MPKPSAAGAGPPAERTPRRPRGGARWMWNRAGSPGFPSMDGALRMAHAVLGLADGEESARLQYFQVVLATLGEGAGVPKLLHNSDGVSIISLMLCFSQVCDFPIV